MPRNKPGTAVALRKSTQPALKNFGLDVPGKLTPTGWQLPEGMPEDQWLAAGLRLSRIESAVQFWIGDWYVHGEHAYGERKALFEPGGPLQDMNFHTVREYGTVARAVRSEERSSLLSFAHHHNVAPLTPAEQRLWLQRAVQGNGNGKPWSSKELKRAMAQEARLAAVEPTEATIVQASCLDWLATQPPCDLLLTDPLYMTDVEDIAAAAAAWLPVALAKVKPTGRAIVCVGAYCEELLAYLRLATPAHMLPPRAPLVWPYRNTIGAVPTHDWKLNWQAVLHYRGVDAPPLNCPEMVEQFAVIDDINAPDGRVGDRWHTWQKPDELCERFIRLASKLGDLVLDPFAGSGSFILAAARLGRVGRGCDIDPEMVALAESRGCRRVP